MGRRNICLTVTLNFALSLFIVSAIWAQVDVGDYRVTGSAEIGGLPRSFSSRDAKFEEYRDIPESVIVPELQLMIGARKKISILVLTPVNLAATTRIIWYASADTAS